MKLFERLTAEEIKALQAAFGDAWYIVSFSHGITTDQADKVLAETLGKEASSMGRMKEKFIELQDRLADMEDEELRDLELMAHSELMSRGTGLDEFLSRAQADEVRVHQPADRNNDYVPF